MSPVSEGTQWFSRLKHTPCTHRVVEFDPCLCFNLTDLFFNHFIIKHVFLLTVHILEVLDDFIL